MQYLLLPFTHGIDETAITYALALADQSHATLILLSLLCQRGRPGKQLVRWEDMQQSTDFLVFVQQKAQRMGVAVEQMVLHTRQPTQSIRALAREMDCKGILLFVRGGKGVLLDTYEVKQLLEDLDYPLYVANLPVGKLQQLLFRLKRIMLHLRPTWLSKHTFSSA
jgi:hypothetical protein